MNTLRRFLAWLKAPHGFWLVFLYILAAASIAGSILLVTLWSDYTQLQFLAYILFALAALLLAYTVYTIIYFVPRIKRQVTNWAQKYEFTDKLLHTYGFRTIIFAIGSLTVSFAYAVFNGTIAILSLSVWYGALAVYYAMLASMRGGILFYHKRKRKSEESVFELKKREIRTYRACGILLVCLPLALSAAVVQMMLSRRSFMYAGMMIYVAAAYTFTKVVMSIVNLIKARKNDDMTVRAIRNINFADALVSLIALQTAMIREFSGASDFKFLNAVTGGLVCAATVLLGVFMIVRANKQLQQLHRQNTEQPPLSAQNNAQILQGDTDGE